MNLQARTYSLFIERDGDKYVAFVPALKSCNAWATSYEQAVKSAGEAVAHHVESLALNGEPIPDEEIDTPLSLGVTVRTMIIS